MGLIGLQLATIPHKTTPTTPYFAGAFIGRVITAWAHG